MNFVLRTTCATVVTAGMFAIVGCDRGPARIVIRGKVTYKGAKVANGWITFAPRNADKGTQEAAHIVDGSYALPSDHGLVPGTYGVAITATEDSGKPAQKEAPGGPKTQPITHPGRIQPKLETEHRGYSHQRS